MDLRKVVLALVGIVVGIIMVTHVVVPAVDTFLERPGLEGFTGLVGFTQLLPLLAVTSIVVGALLLLFRRGDRAGGAAGRSPEHTGRPRLPWRR